MAALAGRSNSWPVAAFLSWSGCNCKPFTLPIRNVVITFLIMLVFFTFCTVFREYIFAYNTFRMLDVWKKYFGFLYFSISGCDSIF